MDGLWERFDLACQLTPDGCDPMETGLRWIIWGFVILGFLIAYAAIRGWTVDINKYLGVVISAAGAYFITIAARSSVADGASLQRTAILAGVLLVIARIGRPEWLRDLVERAVASMRSDTTTGDQPANNTTPEPHTSALNN